METEDPSAEIVRSAESPSEASESSKQPHLCHELQISKSGDVELINVTEMESKKDAEKRHQMEETQVRFVSEHFISRSVLVACQDENQSLHETRS